MVFLLLCPLIESMLLSCCQLASCMYVSLLVLCSVVSPLSVRVDACFAIVGLGGLKSGLTLNHVSPVHGCPSNVLLACVGCKL